MGLIEHEPPRPGFLNVKRPLPLLLCVCMCTFNVNVLGQCFPCRSRRNIPSPASSLVLSAQERVFRDTLNSHFSQRQDDAFKAMKPVEPRITGFEFWLCWEKLNTTTWPGTAKACKQRIHTAKKDSTHFS